MQWGQATIILPAIVETIIWQTTGQDCQFQRFYLPTRNCVLPARLICLKCHFGNKMFHFEVSSDFIGDICKTVVCVLIHCIRQNTILMVSTRLTK